MKTSSSSLLPPCSPCLPFSQCLYEDYLFRADTWTQQKNVKRYDLYLLEDLFLVSTRRTMHSTVVETNQCSTHLYLVSIDTAHEKISVQMYHDIVSSTKFPHYLQILNVVFLPHDTMPLDCFSTCNH